ncbi:MAG: PAS domain S-box protein [Pseudomonadales bacterium]
MEFLLQVPMAMPERARAVLRYIRPGAGGRAALVCLTIVLASTALGGWLYFQRLTQLERATALVAGQARAHLEAWMEARLNGMHMLSMHWPDDYQGNPAAFVRDATIMQQRLPGLLALNWVDPDGVIRVVVPESANRAALGSDLFAHSNPDVTRALTQARQTGEPARTRVLDLLQGGAGFAFYWPVRGARGAPAGFVNGVFRADDLIAASSLAQELGGSFHIELYETEGSVAWSNAPASTRPWPLLTERQVPMIGGPPLVLAMAPSPQTISRSLSLTQIVALLGVCYLVAILLAWLVHQRGLEQAEVRRSERKFRELVELLPHPVYVKDADGHFTFVNRALAGVAGCPAAALLGAGVERLPLTEEERAQMASADAQVLASGEAMALRQESFRDAAGRDRVLEMVRVPFLDPVTGTRSVLGMGVDVTERQESEAYGARIASALNQAGEAITVLDRRGRIVFANPAFAAMMGFGGRSVIGLNMDVFAVDGSDDDDLLAEIAETVGRGETWKRRYSSNWGDGVERVRDATVAPLRDAQGRPNGFIGVLRDVTREQQLEDELRQSQKLEAVGQLAGGIAHDFNNLLTVILGYSVQLRDQAPAGSAEATAVTEIERAAERAADLTGQLLTFSRRRSRRSAVARLNDVIIGLNPMLTRLIGENIAVELELDAAVAEVSAATGELEQIVVNLCLNARDAMPDGGRLRVWTAFRDGTDAPRRPVDLKPGRYAVIGVTDHGCGMTSEVQQRIFEPFFTTKEVGAGTGLGLATVYGIAEQRGGGVHVESAPGRGSTLSVWLPVAAAAADPAAAAEPAVAAPPRAGARVLVVEDEQGIRQLLRTALERAGHEVISAADGIDALQRCADVGDLDLLISDVVMPRMSGPELRDHLLRRHPGLRVLFVSGYSPDQAQTGPLPPGDAFLGKPFRTGDVLDAVARLLGNDAARLAANR